MKKFTLIRLFAGIGGKIMIDLIQMGKNAKTAARELAKASSVTKDKALIAVADALIERAEEIISANVRDLANGRDAGMSEALLDRLSLDKSRIEGMAKGVREVAAEPDPVNRVLSGSTRPNGLKIEKISVPLGVIAVIFEARPNVTSDAAALCMKAGNAVLLRGGKEAVNSNVTIANIMREAVETAGLSPDCIQLVSDTSRESSTALMKLNGYVDVLIPRGGAGLIKAVVENATVPVIETGVGNCHVYVDKDANIDMAAQIVFNAKTSRPSVCNACETMLIHKDIAELALIKIKFLLDTKNVIIRGDEAVCDILPDAVPACEEDWTKEYLDYIIAAKIVSSFDEAAEHIAKYSTGHSECIVTENYETAMKFTVAVDAAAVYVNASTRFTDGGEFGFGAEIGISTQKLHARGPLGLEKLTSEKFVILGQGQTR